MAALWFSYRSFTESPLSYALALQVLASGIAVLMVLAMGLIRKLDQASTSTANPSRLTHPSLPAPVLSPDCPLTYIIVAGTFDEAPQHLAR